MMSLLPNNTDFALAMLSALENKGSCFRRELLRAIEEEFNIEQVGCPPSISNKISVLLTILKRHGLIESRKRGVWSLTSKGASVLREGRFSESLEFLWASPIQRFEQLQDGIVRESDANKIVIPLGPLWQGIRYEKDLQKLLSQVIGHISVNGERLTVFDGPSGIEYNPKHGRKRIDILARTQSGHMVCAELKLHEGYDSHIGKLQSYMGRVMADFRTTNVSGILVAHRITSGARWAALPLGNNNYNITLYEYDVHDTQSNPKLVLTKANCTEDWMDFI